MLPRLKTQVFVLQATCVAFAVRKSRFFSSEQGGDEKKKCFNSMFETLDTFKKNEWIIEN